MRQLPSPEALALVHQAMRDLPEAARILGADPRDDLDAEALLSAYIVVRHTCRDGAVRLLAAQSPASPDWTRLSDLADDFVRLDLTSDVAFGVLLDRTEDHASVVALLACRHVLVSLLDEIERRFPVARAYLRTGRGPQESLRRLSGVLRLRRARRTGAPFSPEDVEDAEADAYAMVTRLYREACEARRQPPPPDAASWAELSAFRKLRPAIISGWDAVAGRFLEEDMAIAFGTVLPALTSSLEDAPAAARRLQHTTDRRQGRRRRFLLQNYDRVREEIQQEQPSPSDALERGDKASADTAMIEAIRRKYDSTLWSAVCATLVGEASDAQGAWRARLALRTFRRRKAQVRAELNRLWGS